MTQETIDKIALLEEAAAIEKADGILRVRHVMAMLSISRATLNRNKFLMARKERRGQRGIGWRARTIRLFQTLEAASDPLAGKKVG